MKNYEKQLTLGVNTNTHTHMRTLGLHFENSQNSFLGAKNLDI